MKNKKKSFESLEPEEKEAILLEEDLKDLTFPENLDPKLLDSLNEILQRYKGYAPNESTQKIEEAFIFAHKAHTNQSRKDGQPYIIHPLAVCEILTELEADLDTLVAALLHDTVEDTLVSPKLVKDLFGQEVATLVEGVTKLGQIAFSTKEEQQAENMRKMFVAMAKDLRVVWIKLADRLHNMRTLKHMPEYKQVAIAKETLDIYAPLAHRLGIYKIKWELEDLCLRYLDREFYYELVGSIAQKRSEREAFLQNVIAELQTKIANMHIEAEIEGRPKHFYSIYNKMKAQGKDLDQIYDLFACRIIVNTVSDCYAVLGLVHNLFYPMPGRFKDYIAMPKPNMYQSLHTTVMAGHGIPFEVQIRTFNMHRTAEYGIAAHWKYKQKDSSVSTSESLDDKLNWLRQLLDWNGESKDPKEFLDSLKGGLVVDEVFVFTPKGDLITLPPRSVPIDLAYNIHSGVGNRMYGAKVNGRIVPLTYELQTGDIIEILTSDKVSGPSRDWLKIVKSQAARSKIKQWFKKEMREENITHGKELLEREIKKTGFTHQQLTQLPIMKLVLKRHSCSKVEDLYASIGHGSISAGKVVNRLKDEYIKSLSDNERSALGYRISSGGQLVFSPLPIGMTSDNEIIDNKSLHKSKSVEKAKKKSYSGIMVKNVDNCLVHLSRCCSPVPGDAIIGYVTKGNGVGVHRIDCPNIRKILKNSANTPKDEEKAGRLIEVFWTQAVGQEAYKVVLSIIAMDRKRLLGDISNIIYDEKASILEAKIQSSKDGTARCSVAIEVKSQNQFERIKNQLNALSGIFEVKRGH